MMRLRFGALVLVLLGCAQGSSTPGELPPCPWPATVSTDADIGEVVDVSVELLERVGGRSTVKVESVYDSEPFIFTPPLLGTEQRLEPYHQSLLRQFASAPREGTFTRTLTLSSTSECKGEDDPVVVTVTTHDGAYRVEPSALDFGAVPSGLGATRTLTLFNDSRGNIRFDLSVPPSAFTISGGITTSVTVPARSKTEFGVHFAPTVTGLHDATLSITAGAHFTDTVALHGVEGGPKLKVSPATIPFGLVGYFPSASATEAWAFATITNEGSHPVDNPTGGRARFIGMGTGTELQVQSLGTPSTLSVRAYWVSGGSFANSTLELDPGQAAKIRLSGSPSTIGQLTASVGIGGLTLFLTADSQVLPPCSMSTSTSVISVPLDGGFFDGGFQNIGTERCFISGIYIDPHDAPFELLSIPDDFLGGETYPLLVRATADAGTDAGATLRFTINSPTTPVQELPIVVEP